MGESAGVIIGYFRDRRQYRLDYSSNEQADSRELT